LETPHSDRQDQLRLLSTVNPEPRVFRSYLDHSSSAVARCCYTFLSPRAGEVFKARKLAIFSFLLSDQRNKPLLRSLWKGAVKFKGRTCPQSCYRKPLASRNRRADSPFALSFPKTRSLPPNFVTVKLLPLGSPTKALCYFW